MRNQIKSITKIIKSNHYTYEQVKYIFKEVRKDCNLKSSRKNKGIKPHLSQEEAKQLVDSAYADGSKRGLMVKTLLFSGMRVSEFCNVKVSDVHLQEKKIYIAVAKGDKPRYIPIFDFLIHELITYLGTREVGYLFETNRHDKYTPRRIQQIVKHYAVQNGILKKITPHRLRATIATWLKDKGMSMDDIQLFLGHSKQETTAIYTRGSVKQIGDMGSKILLE